MCSWVCEMGVIGCDDPRSGLAEREEIDTDDETSAVGGTKPIVRSASFGNSRSDRIDTLQIRQARIVHRAFAIHKCQEFDEQTA